MGVHPAFALWGVAVGGRDTESWKCLRPYWLETFTLCQTCVFLFKNILHCFIAKQIPCLTPTETRWLDFRVRCQLGLWGALCASCSPPEVPSTLCFWAKDSGLAGLLLGRRTGKEASPLSSMHKGSLASKAQSFDLLLTGWLFFKKGFTPLVCSVGSLYGNGLDGWPFQM